MPIAHGFVGVSMVATVLSEGGLKIKSKFLNSKLMRIYSGLV